MNWGAKMHLYDLYNTTDERAMNTHSSRSNVSSLTLSQWQFVVLEHRTENTKEER